MACASTTERRTSRSLPAASLAQSLSLWLVLLWGRRAPVAANSVPAGGTRPRAVRAPPVRRLLCLTERAMLDQAAECENLLPTSSAPLLEDDESQSRLASMMHSAQVAARRRAGRRARFPRKSGQENSRCLLCAHFRYCCGKDTVLYGPPACFVALLMLWPVWFPWMAS